MLSRHIQHVALRARHCNSLESSLSHLNACCTAHARHSAAAYRPLPLDCQALACFSSSGGSNSVSWQHAPHAAAGKAGLLQQAPTNGLLGLLGNPTQPSWCPSRLEHGSAFSLSSSNLSSFHSSSIHHSSGDASSRGASSSVKTAAHAAGAAGMSAQAADQQQQQEHSQHVQQPHKQHKHAPSHHGSAVAAHGMSSYELAAEKMTDREILGTLAHHLWPKGMLTAAKLAKLLRTAQTAAASQQAARASQPRSSKWHLQLERVIVARSAAMCARCPHAFLVCCPIPCRAQTTQSSSGALQLQWRCWCHQSC